MRKFLQFVGLVLLLVCAVLVAREVYAQVPPKAKPPKETSIESPTMEQLATLAAQQFGDRFKLDQTMAPMFGDFDGDGQQDIMMVATGDNPLLGESAFNYKTLDPYNASYGYGNPKVTLAFNTSEGPSRYLLVIHNWNKPARKFVLVNIPFKQLRLGHVQLKKKSVDAVESIDASGIQGAIYWDGKKYKWEIVGSEADR